MQKFLPFLMLSSLTMVSVLGGMIMFFQASSSPDDLSIILQRAREIALSHLNPYESYGQIIADPADVRIEGDYAFGIVVVRAMEGVHSSPRLILYTARRDAESSGGWGMVAEGSPQFTDWLRAAPDVILPSSAARAALLGESIPGLDGAQGGNGTVNLSLPFATGETWWVNGPHKAPGLHMPRPALDMAMLTGNGGLVRASADGVVWRSPSCPNYVRVDHNATWGTGYYHLIDETVSNGQSVTRGTVVGTQGEGIGCGGSASGAHVHYSILRNGTESYIHGHNIGGYMVEAHNYTYQGCMTRLRDNVRFCNGQGVLNEGTIGTGTTDVTFNWLFNQDLVGFSASSNITHLDYANEHNAPRFRITASNPLITSPTFTYAASATNALVVVNLATRNDACGRVFFRRSGDTGFADTRRVDFTPIADGIARDYVIDMSSNANWNGTIVQLGIAPGCTMNADAANRDLTLHRVQLARKPAPNVNLIINPTFASCLDGWAWGQEAWVSQCTGSVLRLGRLANWIGFLSITQDVRSAALIGMPFEVTVNLANLNTTTTHRVAVGLRDPDTLGGALMCTFTLPPNLTSTTHTIRGRVPAGWNETRFDFSPLTVSTSADLQISAVNVQYRPSATFGDFECLPGTRAQATPTITPTPQPPDLRLTISSPAGTTIPTSSTTQINYYFRLENVGGSAADSVQFTSDIPPELWYGGGWYWNAGGGSAGLTCSRTDRRVTCTANQMPASAWVEVRMIAYALVGGTAIVAGSATMAQTDPSPSNNQNVSYTVTIIGPTATPTRTPTATRTATPTLTPTPSASLTVTVPLPGRPAAPHTTLAVPVQVQVTRTSDSVVVYNADVTTDQYGRFTVALPPGTYRVRVKHAIMLSSAGNVTLTTGANTWTLPTLRAGDADSNNVVNIIDFSIMAGSFGLSSSSTGFDARGDFNGDGSVNLSDFTLLAASFGQSGTN